MSLKLIAIIASTIIIMAVILTGAGGNTVSALLSPFLVFVLPGYALVNALFPENNLEAAEFVALMLGLSLAIAAMGGLVLYWLQWELQKQSWTVLLGGITLITSIIALLRHRHLESRPSSFIKVNLSLSFTDGLFFALAGIGVAIALILAYKGEVLQNSSDFTELWILPGEEADSTFVVGINNRSTQPLQYRLLIKVKGKVIKEVPTFNLKSQESWVIPFTFPEGVNSVTAEIYRLYAPADVCNGSDPPDICRQNDEVYRKVVLVK